MIISPAQKNRVTELGTKKIGDRPDEVLKEKHLVL